MKNKFYEFTQNNSGGSFVTNKNLCHRLIIEGESQKKAEEKAFKMGVYYDGVSDGIDCDCCGDRWSAPSELIFPYRYGTFDKTEAQKKAKKYGADYKKTTWGFRNGTPDPNRYDIIFKNPKQYMKYLVSDIRWNKKVEGRIFYLSGKVFEI